MSLKDTDKEQIQLGDELIDMGKSKISLKKREKVVNNFEGKKFMTKNLETGPEPLHERGVSNTPKPTKERAKKSSSKLYGDYLYKVEHDVTNINNEIFN